MDCGEVRPGRFLKPCHSLSRLLTSICEWLNFTCPSRSFQQGIVADTEACSWQSKTKVKTNKEKYGQCTSNMTLRCVRINICTVEKRCVTYSECVFVDLGIHHSQLVRRMLCGLFGSAVKEDPVTRSEGPRGFQEVEVPRLRDNGTGWW